MRILWTILLSVVLAGTAAGQCCAQSPQPPWPNNPVSSGSKLPIGAAPQVVGYDNMGNGEAEALSGDGGDCPTASLARTAAGAYGLILGCSIPITHLIGNSGVIPGTYSNPTFNVNAQGLVTAAGSTTANPYLVNASTFSGVTWVEKVTNAIAALPNNVGIVDARLLCSGGGGGNPPATNTADADLTIGTGANGTNVTVLWGPCTYNFGTHSLYFQSNNTWLGTVLTSFSFSGGGVKWAAPGGAFQPANMRWSDISITGTTNSGIGVDLSGSINGVFTNLFVISGFATDLKLGGAAGNPCACYNIFNNLIVGGPATTYGLDLEANSNANTFNEVTAAYNTTVTGIYLNGSSANVFNPADLEYGGGYSASLLAVTIANGLGNIIHTQQLEGKITFGALAFDNRVDGYGGFFTDNSGSISNDWYVPGGVPPFPIYTVAQLTQQGSGNYPYQTVHVSNWNGTPGACASASPGTMGWATANAGDTAWMCY